MVASIAKKIVWKYWTSSFNDFGCQLNCAYLPLGIALYFFFHICVHLLPPVVTNVVLLSCRQTNFGLGLSHAFFQNGILVCLFSQISCHLLLCRQFVSLMSKPDWFGVLSYIFLFIFLFIYVSIDCEILQSICFPASQNILFSISIRSWSNAKK